MSPPAGEPRAHIGQRRRAGGVVRHQLPPGVGAALEADADAGSDLKLFRGCRIYIILNADRFDCELPARWHASLCRY